MNLIFHIDYHTTFGEELVLNLITSNHEGTKEVSSCRMATVDGCQWTCIIDRVLKNSDNHCLDYYYSVVRDSELLRTEWILEPHRLELTAVKGTDYIVYDHWTDIPDNAYLYSSAFTDCINRHERMAPVKHSFARTVRLKVRAPQLRRGEWLAVLGNEPSMGEWSVANAVPMVEHNYNEWMVDFDVSQLTNRRFELKFVILDEDVDVTPTWERCDNRVIFLPEMNDGDVVVYELPEARFDIYDIKCAGTLVPVFSLGVEFRRRRLRRPAQDGRLGGTYPSAAAADPSHQRHHHHPHLDRLLSLQLHQHLRPPSSIRRPHPAASHRRRATA